jgi:hypothetical protein
VTATLARIAALLSAAPASLAFAYRPFDGTDASVSDLREFELELGTSYLHEGDDDSFAIPTVANYGIGGGREIVLEGEIVRELGDEGESRTSLLDTALSLKQIHRAGSLQDGSGVSVASECGVLLPTIHGDEGVGAACALIASQSWPAVTLHVNGGLTFNRDQRWEESLGAIVEGSENWRIRPASELRVEWASGEPTITSLLIGLIWRADAARSLDLGARYAEADDLHGWEFRAGLTWRLRKVGGRQ